MGNDAATDLVGAYRKRRVIPRWRPSATIRWHVYSPERATKSRDEKGDLESVDSSWALWKESHHVGYLADAFSTALQLGDPERKSKLAKEILSNSQLASIQLLASARNVLGSERAGSGVAERVSRKSPDPLFDVREITQFISSARAALSYYPRNPLLWNDLAFAYNLLNEPMKAERAMLSAINLGRWNPWLVRAGTRLFTHLGDSDTALSLTTRFLRHETNPLVLSAHIAVSQIAERPASQMNRARKEVGRLRRPSLVWSELYMAIATQMFFTGDNKRLKRFLRDWKGQHTENSFAQGVWMNQVADKKLFDERKVFLADVSFEGSAWQQFKLGNWRETVTFASQWLSDQPFSSRPAVLGSFVCTTFLGDYAEGKRFAERGLGPNPTDWTLRNNLIVAFVKLRESEQAQRHFLLLKRPPEDDQNFALWLATKGLMCYSDSDVEAAREFYRMARRSFRKQRDAFAEALAAYFQIGEEAALGNFEYVQKILDQIDAVLKPKIPLEEKLKSKILEFRNR